ncbi:MAG: hypothetical protein IJA62_02520 [Ruminococcus sp.]|nr:hypothetical protein [Ruminococcus sp.]
MKNKVSVISVFVVLSVILSITVTIGCSGKGNNFDVSGQTTDGVDDAYFISSVEEVENLVTDDNKLVINYFDAYIWIVFFDDESKIEHMVYIYEFEDEAKAESMISERTKELSKNKTMTIDSAYNVSNYLIVSLYDTSFTNISRSILENNFNGLIVY